MNYTKGNWGVGKKNYRKRQTELRIICPDGDDLHFGDIQGLTQDEAIANAHLIAAAPEMYEALKVIDEYLSASYPANMKLKQTAANLLVSALAKAEATK